MPMSPRSKFTVTVLVSLLGFVLTLVAPEEADVGKASTPAARVQPKR